MNFDVTALPCLLVLGIHHALSRHEKTKRETNAWLLASCTISNIRSHHMIYLFGRAEMLALVARSASRRMTKQVRRIFMKICFRPFKLFQTPILKFVLSLLNSQDCSQLRSKHTVLLHMPHIKLLANSLDRSCVHMDMPLRAVLRTSRGWMGSCYFFFVSAPPSAFFASAIPRSALVRSAWCDGN